MKLNELSSDRQVSYLTSLLRSGRSVFPTYVALFAFRHNLATKHSPDFSQKPVLRWYLGQLAREYITKHFNEAKENLENLAEIGLLEVSENQDSSVKEYRLNEALYPALLEVMEEIFGKEYVSKMISRAKYFRNPESRKTRRLDENFSEVKE